MSVKTTSSPVVLACTIVLEGKMMAVSTLSATEIEGYKLVHDTFKHLTTLSTGSVVLLATFLKDLFQHPGWPWLVAISLFLFLVSTVASVIVMLAIGDLVGSDGGSLSVPGLEVSAVPCIVISWIAFLLG